MTVAELIESLKTEDQNRLVVMAADPEGNRYRELDETSTASYSNGDVGLEELTDEDVAAGYREEDVLDAPPALILWPK